MECLFQIVKLNFKNDFKVLNEFLKVHVTIYM